METKKRVHAVYAELAERAAAIGMRTLADEIRTTRIPKLDNEHFHVVILGEFNHGKSTFVNALLGADVLPTGITPTTAVIHHVLYGETPGAQLVFASGERTEIAVGDLPRWAEIAGDAERLSHIEVRYPAEILSNQVILVDTPGVNDLNEQRAEITYGYVPRADAVIFLLDAGQALKDSEREFLATQILDAVRERMTFVVGKIDTISSADRDTVLAYLQRELRALVPDPKLFPLSARRALESATDDPDMRALTTHLERDLAVDRMPILLDNAAREALRTTGYLQHNLGVRKTSLTLDLQTLEERARRLREELSASKRKLDAVHARIATESSAMKTRIRLDLAEFVADFRAAIPHQIAAADADDIQRYLPSFIEHKFQEWAQAEGHTLATLLQGLAEDIIAITNENVADVATTLRHTLDPADTQVPIDLDILLYDAGAYAIGALGTTVFLFVSTVAGSLLTLCAPIVAIILRSKLAGDTREQANDLAPVAIERAGEAMGPHFERCIDDFAGRLGEFVTTAGHSLYRGITEVLDQVLTERRAHEGDEVALDKAASQHLRELATLKSELEALRGAIWS